MKKYYFALMLSCLGSALLHGMNNNETFKNYCFEPEQACYKNSTLAQIRDNILNICNCKQITISIHTEEEKNLGLKISYTLCDDNKKVLAESVFGYQEKNPIAIYLAQLNVAEDLQGKGLGEQWFYLLMYSIHNQYPKVKLAYWIIVSEAMFNSERSFSEDHYKLFKFYRRVGARVEEDSCEGSLNLIEGGYCDEN